MRRVATASRGKAQPGIGGGPVRVLASLAGKPSSMALAADGHPVDPDDLATIAPYITHTIRRFGDWVLDLSPPEAAPVTALNLAPGALFPGGRFDPYPG
jgi:hypothetical protein